MPSKTDSPLPSPPRFHRWKVSLTGEGVLVELQKRTWWGGWRRTGNYVHQYVKEHIRVLADVAATHVEGEDAG